MSNIDKITSTSKYSVVDQEQLFTELSLEEGAVIEGGLTYDLSNDSGVGINYDINGKSAFFKPGDQKQYFYCTAPTVSYDSQIGPGYVPVYQQLVSEPGHNSFYVANGSTLFLIQSGADHIDPIYTKNG